MKLAIINSVTYGSTGKIASQLNDLANLSGIDSYLFVPKGRHNKGDPKNKIIAFGSRFSEDSHLILGKITGMHGVFSKIATKRLVKKLKDLEFDCVHLHNLHNDYINLKILFNYLVKNNIRIIWTFHDCWPFTGRCPYFTLLKCNKWLGNCENCEYPLKSYPESFLRKEKKNLNIKKKFFSMPENMTIVTPSKWLAGLVGQSFFRKYDIKVINNGIDLNVFNYKGDKFRVKNKLEDKYIILGVAFDWGIRKGLDIFIEMSKKVSDQYVFVLVGTNEEIDKILPKNFISIHKTNNQEELAEIYSSADVFFNPTREDNYPTVNMEAIACNVPVVTFETGGSAEIISKDTGFAVCDNSIEKSLENIKNICENKVFKGKDFKTFSQKFDKNERFKEYIALYNEK